MKYLALILTLLFASAANATVSAAFSTNLTSGPAPLFIHFDATASTDTESARPFHDLEYIWSFGDTSPGNWTHGGVTSKNSDFGPIAGHVFETVGSFTVELSVTSRANEANDTVTVEITVTDPDTVFAGALTTCFYTDSVGDNCPSGATEVQSDEFDVKIDGMPAGERYLFKCGNSFLNDSGNGRHDFSGVGPSIIGAYGVCTGSNRPIVYSGFRLGNDSTDTTKLTIMDLDINSAISTNKVISTSWYIENILVLRVDAVNINGIVNMSTGDATDAGKPTTHKYNGFIDCDIDVGTAGTTAAFFGGMNHGAVMGVNLYGVEPNGEHALRWTHARYSLIAHSRFADVIAEKGPITIRDIVHGGNTTHGFINGETQWNQVSFNLFPGSEIDGQTVTVGHNETFSEGGYIVDGNTFLKGTYTERYNNIETPNATVRYNNYEEGPHLFKLHADAVATFEEYDNCLSTDLDSCSRLIEQQSATATTECKC